MKFKELSGWIPLTLAALFLVAVLTAPAASGNAGHGALNSTATFVRHMLGLHDEGGDGWNPPATILPSPQDGPGPQFTSKVGQ